MRTVLFAALMTLALAFGLTAQTQPLLQLQGQPHFGGSMTLHLSGTVGQPALLAYGLNPLTTPIQTGKGPWFIGSMMNLIALGNIPTGGRINLPFTMPPLIPALAGISIVMQGYVPWRLSNPAALLLDLPYLDPSVAQVIPSPNPTPVALFGRRLVVGDLNADGHEDLIGSAYHEDYQGIESSGRVYVLWGPTYAASTPLSSAAPRENGFFGISVSIARLDTDEIDDLIVGETAGDPPGPGISGDLHIFLGADQFAAAPTFTLPSPGTGLTFTGYGHAVATGDYNDDTFTDIAVSINKATVQGLPEAGRIDVLLGPAFTTTVQILNPQPESNHGFGSSLVTADANGDGIDDLMESSGGDDIGGLSGIGSAHVYAGPTLQQIAFIPCPAPLGAGTAFGIHLGAADLNADGLADLLADDRKDRVFICWAPGYSTHTIVPKPPASFPVALTQSEYGIVLSAGDMNADGIADLLISDATDGDASGCSISGGGTVYAALGPYLATFHTMGDVTPGCSNWFGEWCLVSDVDGDGISELVVGDPSADDSGIPNGGHITILGGIKVPGG